MIPIPKPRRDAMRGDDLVGGPAGDLGHAVEGARKTAGAGGGRAQFHDQIADLRLRHGGADAVPAGPTLAGVEAEDLAASVGQTISTTWIGSSSTGWHCGSPSLMPIRAAVRNARSEESTL